MIFRRITLLLFCFGTAIATGSWLQFNSALVAKNYPLVVRQLPTNAVPPTSSHDGSKSLARVIRGQNPSYGGYSVEELPSESARATDSPGYRTTTTTTNPDYRTTTTTTNPGYRTATTTTNPGYRTATTTTNPGYRTATTTTNPGYRTATTTTNPGYRTATTTTNPGYRTATTTTNPGYRTATTTAANPTPAAQKTPVTIYPAGAGVNRPTEAAAGVATPYPPVQLAQYAGQSGARNATPFLPETPLVQTPSPTPIDLDVMLEEAQTGRIMFGVGVNSDSGLIGNVVIDEQNFDFLRWPTGLDDWVNGTAFRGAGQHFRMEALPGTQLQRYSMSFAEPYIFGSSVSLGLSAFYYERQYLNWDERRWGGRASLGYIFPERPDLSTTFAARYEEINILEPTIPTPPVLAEVVGENQLIAFRWNVAHDTRDNAFLPTEGHLVELAFDQAIGTWVYPRFVGDLRKYLVTRQRPDGSGRHVLGLAGTLGITGSDTPIYDNFFAGGFATIRGFTFRGASPKVGDVIVGGHLELITSAEYLFPLTANDNVFGAFFIDAGTVERDINIAWSDFRITPGFELRLNVPALGPVPLAVGIGVPVQHAPTDNIRNFHFFVGVSR